MESEGIEPTTFRKPIRTLYQLKTYNPRMLLAGVEPATF